MFEDEHSAAFERVVKGGITKTNQRYERIRMEREGVPNLPKAHRNVRTEEELADECRRLFTTSQH